MKKNIVIIIIALQLVVIGVLAYRIYKEKTNVLGTTHVNIISKEDIIEESKNDYGFEYELKPNNKIEIKESDVPYKASYTINADSLNERFDYTTEKDGGVFRIVVLGNSYTFGAYVDTKDNWTEVIEDFLNSDLKCKNINKFEVVNLAGRGYDVKYLVERFYRKGEKYNPDMIIWFLTNNDFIQINDILLPKMVSQSQILKEKGDEKAYFNAWELALKELRVEYKEDELITKQIKLLDQLRKNFDKRILFVTYASFTKDVYKEAMKKFTASYPDNTFFFGEVTNIYESNEWFYLTDGHPTQKGHEVMAEAIFEYLKDKNLINCR